MSSARVLAVLAVIVVCGSSWAQQKVPPKLQTVLILKVLSYDRNLKKRHQDTIRVGVLYKAADATSTALQRQVLEQFQAISHVTVQGLRVDVVALKLENREQLAQVLEREKIGLLYLCPALGSDLKAITGLTRSKKIVTCSGMLDYVKSGITLGIIVRERRPKIAINTTAARAEGADFETRVLELAEIYR